jgi:hypothetical protein
MQALSLARRASASGRTLWNLEEDLAIRNLGFSFLLDFVWQFLSKSTPAGFCLFLATDCDKVVTTFEHGKAA